MILPSVQWTVQFLSSQGNIKIEFSEAYYSLKNINKKMIPFPTANSHIFFFFLTKSLFLDKKKKKKTAGQLNFLNFIFYLFFSEKASVLNLSGWHCCESH